MKNLMNKLLILLSFVTVFTACEDEDLVVINEDFTTVVTLSDNDIVLEEANEDLQALSVKWTEPDFGYNAAAEYNILFSLGANSETVNAGRPMSEGGTMEKTFTTGELNRIMLNLEAEPGTASTVGVHVDVILSKQVAKSSAAQDLTATAYSGVIDLTTPWGVVGDATPGGWGDPGPDTPFYKTDEDGVYVAYITMTEGFWKIRRDNNWDVNYGSNDGVNLQPGGDNIPVDPGTYKITFDENNLTYTIETFTWGLVGDATPGGWGNPGEVTDTPLEYDPCSDTWKVVIRMTEGKWKIRQNNDWAVNYGDTGLDGALDAGGDDIPVTAGTYLVTVNFNDNTYTILEDSYGIVGSATENGWDGPDVPFTPDYCNEGLYYAYNVTLVDGLIKFRRNNQWDENYGDDGDGVLEPGGPDIPVAAGVYNFVLDLTNPSVPTYTLTEVN